MISRHWLRPILLGLLLTGCGNLFDRFSDQSRKKRRKRKTQQADADFQRAQKKGKAKGKRAIQARREKQAAADANTRVSDRSPVEIRGQAPADAPNILLISLDTLRADALPVYGGIPDNAPALTTLAREGIYFENSYAQAPSTSPTHASMFTSVLPSEHGVMGTKDRLPLSHWTLSEHLQAYGYRTWASASSVRFALGVQLNQGFDEYAVYSKGSQINKSNKAMNVALESIPDAPERPWFGFVHFMDVHAPYLVPEPHQSRYLNGKPSVDPKKTVRFLHKHRTNKSGVSAMQIADLKSMYAGGVSHVDTRVAKLIDAVKQLERPTLIVVTADHGEAFFEKNYLGHGTFVHEPIMRVPLIFWAPALVPQGAARQTLAQSIDLFPTLCAYAQVPPPEDLQGANLRPVIQGETELTGRSVIGQSRHHQMLVRDSDDGIWKLVLNGKNKKPKLYALHQDPLEQTNIGQSHPDVVADMTTDLVAVSFRQRRKQTGQTSEAWEMSDEEREALEAIGYMDASH